MHTHTLTIDDREWAWVNIFFHRNVDSLAKWAGRGQRNDCIKTFCENYADRRMKKRYESIIAYDNNKRNKINPIFLLWLSDGNSMGCGCECGWGRADFNKKWDVRGCMLFFVSLALSLYPEYCHTYIMNFVDENSKKINTEFPFS